MYKASSGFDQFGNPNWELYPSGDYSYIVEWVDNSLNYNNSDYPPLEIKSGAERIKHPISDVGKFFRCFCPFLEGILPEGDFCQAINRQRFISVLRVTVQVKGFCRPFN